VYLYPGIENLAYIYGCFIRFVAAAEDLHYSRNWTAAVK